MSRSTLIATVPVLAALLAAPLAAADEDWGFWTPLGDVYVDPDALAGTSPDALLADPQGAAGRAVTHSVSFDPDWLEPPAEEEKTPEEPADEASSGGAPPPQQAPDEEHPGLFGLSVPAVSIPPQVVILKKRLVDPTLDLPLLAPVAPAAETSAPAPAGPSFVPASTTPASEPVPEPVAASAAVIALASAAAIATAVASPAGFDWERVRRFGFAALLYTRIAKDKLLDHGRRDALLQAIRERPGATLIDLAEATAIPRNTATYHLNRLEREGFITSARRGRARHWFAVGGEARRAQADAFAALRHDKGRALALAVGASPGLDQQALCAKLGLAPSLVHWHADRLLAAGVLSKAREGRHVRYHPGPSYSLVEKAPQERGAAPGPLAA